MAVKRDKPQEKSGAPCGTPDQITIRWISGR
ncbi:hypothetical protein ABIB73_005565 [Bradyrhizobium sp. F1.4.3]